MKKSPSDHVLAAAKAGLSTIPVVGGSIASLIGDYIPLSTQRAIEQAIEELQARLTALEDRIDADAVDKEQFAELFKSCYLVIVRTHDEQRRHAAVSLVVNMLLRDGDSEKLPYTELDHFVRALDFLSLGAIQVLVQAVSLARTAHFARLESDYYRFNFSDLYGKAPTNDPYLLMGLVGELDVANLIHQPTTPGARDSRDLYGNYPLELTPLGVRFVTRLLD